MGSRCDIPTPSRGRPRCRRDGGLAPLRAGAVRRLHPGAILYGLFFLVPFGLIVGYSFWQTIDYEVVHNWTIDNYRYFFSVPTYVRTMWATLWVSFAATAITLLMAFPLAYWLVRYVRKSLQGFFLVLIVVPFWTSYLLRVYSWLNILGEGGAINRFLQWTGLTDAPVSFFLYDRPAVILVLVYLYPFAALTLYASLEKFDWDQYKAALDLGAPPRTAMTRIVLPRRRESRPPSSSSSSRSWASTSPRSSSAARRAS